MVATVQILFGVATALLWTTSAVQAVRRARAERGRMAQELGTASARLLGGTLLAMPDLVIGALLVLGIALLGLA